MLSESSAGGNSSAAGPCRTVHNVACCNACEVASDAETDCVEVCQLGIGSDSLTAADLGKANFGGEVESDSDARGACPVTYERVESLQYEMFSSPGSGGTDQGYRKRYRLVVCPSFILFPVLLC